MKAKTCLDTNHQYVAILALRIMRFEDAITLDFSVRVTDWVNALQSSRALDTGLLACTATPAAISHFARLPALSAATPARRRTGHKADTGTAGIDYQPRKRQYGANHARARSVPDVAERPWIAMPGASVHAKSALWARLSTSSRQRLGTRPDVSASADASRDVSRLVRRAARHREWH
jgi:hypothetical protein